MATFSSLLFLFPAAALALGLFTTDCCRCTSPADVRCGTSDLCCQNGYICHRALRPGVTHGDVNHNLVDVCWHPHTGHFGLPDGAQGIVGNLLVEKGPDTYQIERVNFEHEISGAKELRDILRKPFEIGANIRYLTAATVTTTVTVWDEIKQDKCPVTVTFTDTECTSATHYSKVIAFSTSVPRYTIGYTTTPASYTTALTPYTIAPISYTTGPTPYIAGPTSYPVLDFTYAWSTTRPKFEPYFTLTGSEHTPFLVTISNVPDQIFNSENNSPSTVSGINFVSPSTGQQSAFRTLDLPQADSTNPSEPPYMTQKTMSIQMTSVSLSLAGSNTSIVSRGTSSSSIIFRDSVSTRPTAVPTTSSVIEALGDAVQAARNEKFLILATVFAFFVGGILI